MGNLYLDGSLNVWTNNSNNPDITQIPNLPPISAIVATSSAFYFLDLDGKVWFLPLLSSISEDTEGSKDNEGVQEIVLPNPVLKISGKNNWMLALDRRGWVWGWGDNSSFQLSVENPEPFFATPIKLNDEHGIGYATDLAVGPKSALIIHRPPVFIDGEQDQTLSMKDSTYRYLAPIQGDPDTWLLQINSRSGKAYRTIAKMTGVRFGQRY